MARGTKSSTLADLLPLSAKLYGSAPAVRYKEGDAWVDRGYDEVLDVVRSLGWLIPVQLGAYAGYLTFGFIADRIGRRAAFVLFMIGAAVLAPVYGQFARSPLVLMVAGPLLGYFASGHFSMFGGFVAELFPTRIRATGQGTSYNIGRMAGAIAPYTIGTVATIPGVGIGLALGVTSAFFLLAAALVFTLPDRSGQALD